MSQSFHQAALQALLERRRATRYEGSVDELEALYDRRTAEGERAYQDACRLAWAARESDRERGVRHLGCRVHAALQTVGAVEEEVRLTVVERARRLYLLRHRLVEERELRLQRMIVTRATTDSRGHRWRIAADDCPEEIATAASSRPGTRAEWPIRDGSSEAPAPSDGPGKEQADPPGQSDAPDRDRAHAPGYDRAAARRYAETWWDGFNPAYRAFPVDCTNFVSQALFAGTAPMVFGRRDQGWWYRGGPEQWSYSWAVAHSLRWYLPQPTRGLRATAVASARELQIGDVIAYDFTGDGHWEHNTIVVGHDPAGQPLVAAHTAPAWNRYWDYKTSGAYTDNIRYVFFRIADRW